METFRLQDPFLSMSKLGLNGAPKVEFVSAGVCCQVII